MPTSTEISGDHLRLTLQRPFYNQFLEDHVSQMDLRAIALKTGISLKLEDRNVFPNLELDSFTLEPGTMNVLLVKK